MKTEFIIARAFWKSAFTNQATYALIGVIAVLFFYAGYTGWNRYKSQNEMQEHYQHEARESWLGNPDKHPHRMAHYGHFAFRPKSTLSFFDTGMESYFGNAIFLEAHVQNTTNFSEAGFSTGMLRFGEISIASLLQIVLPLLIIIVGFSSVASERETGTLKIYFTQGVSWKQLLIGKSLGCFLVVMTIFVPVLLISFAGWLMLAGSAIGASDLLKALLLFLIYSLYLAIFCIGTTLISALSKTSKTTLAVLIGMWLAFIIILPKTTQSVGSLVYKTPSKVQFALDVEADIIKTGDSHNPDDPHYKKFKDSVLKANKVDSVQNLEFNYSGLVMREGERITAAINNDHNNRLRKLYQRQNAFVKITAFINPYMAVKNLSMALAGTDFFSYTDFQQQAEAYRYNLAQTMNELQIKHIPGKSVVSTEQPAVINKKYWSTIEDFHYENLGLSSVLQNESLSIIAFLFWVAFASIGIMKISKKLNVL